MKIQLPSCKFNVTFPGYAFSACAIIISVFSRLKRLINRFLFDFKYHGKCYINLSCFFSEMIEATPF